MTFTPQPKDLEFKIQSLMRAQVSDELDFSSVASEVFAYQFRHNLPYQRYCEALEVSPDNVSHWKQIPAITTDAFKSQAHPLVCFPTYAASHKFLTSGTTQDVRGQHFFPTITLYESSIIAAWKTLDLPEPASVIILTPKPENAPHSSLSYMMGVLEQHYEGASVLWAIDDHGQIDIDLIESAVAQQSPIAILGTALAFLHLCENHRLPLPAGSFAMETGGYKGTGRQMEKEDLYALFQRQLGLPPESIINEYSMTELSSQFYTRGLGEPHHGPSWTRTQVIDPRTGHEAVPGEPGYLAIYDLANLHSVMAIQTQDIAVATHQGSFQLLGRDPSALPRGCSRAADHAMQSS
ncbi:hypothetical protein JIN77_02920 [Verrucomicrobiaceae bacterium R5-34]|nr:hypothetical protein [Verrucomicrobiaceae bacterium R5-34]